MLLGATEEKNHVNIRRRPAVGASIASAVALNSDDPAKATTPLAEDTYTFNSPGVSGVTWTITALCDQINGSRYYKNYSNPDIQEDFCVHNIKSAPAEQINHQDKLQNYSGRARLISGFWTLQINVTDGVSCPGGGTAQSAETYAFDDETLAGTHTTLHGVVCGLQPKMSKQPSTPQLTGPPPSPIERYPLYCNDIAICY